MKWTKHRYKDSDCYDVTIRDSYYETVLLYGCVEKRKTWDKYLLHIGFGTTIKDYCFMEWHTSLEEAKAIFENLVFNSFTDGLKNIGRIRRVED